MRVIARRTRLRLAEERGITLILALMTLTVTTALLGTAFVAVVDNAGSTRNALDQERALSAAEAGIQAFVYQLNANPNYWESCPTATGVTVPSSTDDGSTETYSYKPLPASTAPSTDDVCDTSNPGATMIEASGAAAGTFRISSTGTSDHVSRTVVAQFKRDSFLNYLWYTDYETLDPSALPTHPTDCDAHYPHRGSDCGPILNFAYVDQVNGPMHSEDTIAYCGKNSEGPTFGRTSADAIEAPAFSTEGQSGCSTTYNMLGTYNDAAPSLVPPPTDTQLYNETQTAYQFTGATHIVLNGATMTVTNANLSGGSETVAFPSNGVVYVSASSSGCPFSYSPFNPSYSDSGCGNVYVSGNYTSSLTIGAAGDVIIDGSITTPVDASGVPTGNAVLGLIANDFVRVYHPLNGRTGDTQSACNSATNASGSLTDPVIYAAILAVNHSFMVDNWDCGAPMGTLTVYGTIAQLFRGAVATSSGSGSSFTIVTGYAKHYTYDDRLAYEEPPYFLNPVSAGWYVTRSTECDSTANC